MVISHRAYQQNKTGENWLDLKKRVEAFDNYRMKTITYDKQYTDRWFPGYWRFCNWLTGDFSNAAYYADWPTRKREVLRKGVKSMGMGFGDSFGQSFIREPLTLDFSKEQN